MEFFIDKLIEAVKSKNNPTVVGLDPKMEYIPSYIKTKNFNEYGITMEACGKAIFEYNKGIINAVYDIIPAVKPQLAYYEMYGIEGIKAFNDTCKYAGEKGLLIIADGKRNDIGPTSEAYSKAYLGRTEIADGIFGEAFTTDALTVNPYLGADGILPFVQDCKDNGKGIFILVKTSNKSSGDFQDLTVKTSEGEKYIYETVAELVDKWGKPVTGKYGYSSVGAVVGATYPEQAATLRKIMPKSYILVPGYGAQGGTAKDVAVNFNDDGLGAIVNASRSIICAYSLEKWKDKFDERSYAEAARAEALDMKNKLMERFEQIL